MKNICRVATISESCFLQYSLCVKRWFLCNHGCLLLIMLVIHTRKSVWLCDICMSRWLEDEIVVCGVLTCAGRSVSSETLLARTRIASREVVTVGIVTAWAACYTFVYIC